MDVFCCITPSHEGLFREYFKPSLADGFRLHCHELDSVGSEDMGEEFLRCICLKVNLILRSLRDHWGEVIVWTDVDVRFLGLSPEDLRRDLGSHDIALQRECKGGSAINAGFFVCRCNARVEKFFERVRDCLRERPHLNEQPIMNELLQSGDLELDWTLLPHSYYARTHGWPPPLKRLKLYHANYTMGERRGAQKITQFRELEFMQRFPLAGLVLTSVKYAPRRVKRVTVEFFRSFRRQVIPAG